jgi:phosphatidylglycerol:prolipoprotein diacylglycerol transferase
VYPVLFEIGGLTLRSYGLMLALSFAIGIYLAWARAPLHGVDRESLLDICIVIVVCSLAGSRLLYIAEHASQYAAAPGRMLALREGGLSMYGGVVLAALGAAAYCRWKSISFLAVADVCAPSLALGEAITRIGCFLNGCCYGLVSSLPWALVFPTQCPAGRAFPGAAIHPTQLYASLANLAIFGALLWTARRGGRPGRVIGLFLVLHALVRLGVETLRHHGESAIAPMIGGFALSPSRVACLALIVLGSYVLMRSRSAQPPLAVARSR